jgi:hypothetical protein
MIDGLKSAHMAVAKEDVFAAVGVAGVEIFVIEEQRRLRGGQVEPGKGRADLDIGQDLPIEQVGPFVAGTFLLKVACLVLRAMEDRVLTGTWACGRLAYHHGYWRQPWIFRSKCHFPVVVQTAKWGDYALLTTGGFMKTTISILNVSWISPAMQLDYAVALGKASAVLLSLLLMGGGWGTLQAAPAPEREFHVVSTSTSGTSQSPGHVAVSVNRPGKQVILYVNCYNSAVWHITVAPDTIIERVILGGYEPQKVQGLAPEVEVIQAYFTAYSGFDSISIGTTVDSSSFYSAVPKLRALTGLEMASFHGLPTSPYPTPIVIESVQDDARLQSNYPQAVPVTELPNLHFQVAFFNGYPPYGTATTTGTVAFREYTLAGPVDEAMPLLKGTRVTTNASTQYYYGANWQTVFQVEAASGICRTMTLDAGLPELSWPMGLTYDSQHQRVDLVSLGGEGYLYAYNPSRSTWSVLTSMNNQDYGLLEYHAAEDMLYATSSYMSGAAPRTLYRLSPAGAVLSQMALPVLPNDSGASRYRGELVSVGDYLVLIFGPEYYQTSST